MSSTPQPAICRTRSRAPSASAPRSILADPKDTVLSGRGLVKTFGKVVGLDGVNIDLFPARSCR